MTATALPKARPQAMSDQASANAPNIAAEFRLLVALTRNPAGAASVAVSHISETFDWQRFCALAEFHRVEGLVAATLAANRPAFVPQDVRDYFADRLRTHSLRGLLCARATAGMTRKLAQNGIPVMLLKGHAVANRYYEAPHARQSIDIDVLVPEHLVGPAQRVLESLGYALCHPKQTVPAHCHGVLRDMTNDVSFVREADGTKLELHWRLSRNPRLFGLGTEEFRRRATAMPVGDTEVTVFEPVALLTFLVCHGAKHAWFRLKWLADIERVLDKMAPEQLSEAIELSRRNGTLHLLATSLRLHQLVYGTTYPLAADLAPHVDERLLHRFLAAVSALPRPHERVTLAGLWRTLGDLRFDMSLRKEPSYKIAAALDYLRDVRDIETLRLSRRWLWVYAVAGPVLAVGRLLVREGRSWIGAFRFPATARPSATIGDAVPNRQRAHRSRHTA